MVSPMHSCQRQRHANKLGLFVIALLSWHKVIGQTCKPKDCIDLKCFKVSTARDGKYIYPAKTSFSKLKVTCNQTADSVGGWIVYMRRFDGSTSFKQVWDKYKKGFGYQGDGSESWLGNEKVYQLIKSFEGGKAQLRVEGYLLNGTSCNVTSDDFMLENEAEDYMLRFGHTVDFQSVPGVAADWESHKDMPFATPDHTLGNDACFKAHTGGWWFTKTGGCYRVYLTGKYATTDVSVRGMHIKTLGDSNTLKASAMMFRPTKKIRACHNPCKSGGTCEYVESTNSHRCICAKEYCGANCETANPCKHGGTCVFNAVEKKISCKCVEPNTGAHCDDGDEVEPDTSAQLTAISIASVLVVLVIAVVIVTTINKNKQRRLQEEERLAKEEEERERERLLAAIKKKEDNKGFFDYLFPSE